MAEWLSSVYLRLRALLRRRALERDLQDEVAFHPGASVRAFHDSLSRNLMTLPGVRSVAVATDLPLTTYEFRVFTPDGSNLPAGHTVTTSLAWVHGPYFGSCVHGLRAPGMARGTGQPYCGTPGGIGLTFSAAPAIVIRRTYGFRYERRDRHRDARRVRHGCRAMVRRPAPG